MGSLDRIKRAVREEWPKVSLDSKLRSISCSTHQPLVDPLEVCVQMYCSLIEGEEPQVRCKAVYEEWVCKRCLNVFPSLRQVAEYLGDIFDGATSSKQAVESRMLRNCTWWARFCSIRCLSSFLLSTANGLRGRFRPICASRCVGTVMLSLELESQTTA